MLKRFYSTGGSNVGHIGRHPPWLLGIECLIVDLDGVGKNPVEVRAHGTCCVEAGKIVIHPLIHSFIHPLTM